MVRAEDLALLGVELPLSVETLKTRWRNLARVAHPDVGGDAGTFARLSEAYGRLLLEATTCVACGGSGRAVRRSGLTEVATTCRCKLRRTSRDST